MKNFTKKLAGSILALTLIFGGAISASAQPLKLHDRSARLTKLPERVSICNPRDRRTEPNYDPREDRLTVPILDGIPSDHTTNLLGQATFLSGDPAASALGYIIPEGITLRVHAFAPWGLAGEIIVILCVESSGMDNVSPYIARMPAGNGSIFKDVFDQNATDQVLAQYVFTQGNELRRDLDEVFPQRASAGWFGWGRTVASAALTWVVGSTKESV